MSNLWKAQGFSQKIWSVPNMFPKYGINWTDPGRYQVKLVKKEWMSNKGLNVHPQPFGTRFNNWFEILKAFYSILTTIDSFKE
jgi:hypothetical protein